MTPAQLAVERDALLSGGRTLEEVERMQSSHELLTALRVVAWEYGRDMDLDAPGIFWLTDHALRLAGHGGVWVARGESFDRLVADMETRRVSGLVGLGDALSLHGSASGASAPRPSGETP